MFDDLIFSIIKFGGYTAINRAKVTIFFERFYC
jgi:hypothetical protein